VQPKTLGMKPSVPVIVPSAHFDFPNLSRSLPHTVHLAGYPSLDPTYFGRQTGIRAASRGQPGDARGTLGSIETSRPPPIRWRLRKAPKFEARAPTSSESQDLDKILTRLLLGVSRARRSRGVPAQTSKKAHRRGVTVAAGLPRPYCNSST
jgi:hypothetical protein